MIVVHSKKLIFLKTRKTAGSSFEIALSKFCDDEDIITSVGDADDETRKTMGLRGLQNDNMSIADMFQFRNLRMLKNLSRGQWPKKYYQHISAKLAKQRLGDQIWNDYTKVAIVRNPYDYAISSYFWAMKNTPKKPPFETWCLKKPKMFRFNHKHYFIGDEIVVDHFIRFEHFQEDTLELERLLGLEGLHSTFSDIKAKGNHRPKAATIDDLFKGADKLKALIRRENAFEIERFGYQPPD